MAAKDIAARTGLATRERPDADAILEDAAVQSRSTGRKSGVANQAYAPDGHKQSIAVGRKRRMYDPVNVGLFLIIETDGEATALRAKGWTEAPPTTGGVKTTITEHRKQKIRTGTSTRRNPGTRPASGSGKRVSPAARSKGRRVK